MRLEGGLDSPYPLPIRNFIPTLQFLSLDSTSQKSLSNKRFTMQWYFITVLLLLLFCTIMTTTTGSVAVAFVRSIASQRIWSSRPAARQYRRNIRPWIPSIATSTSCSSSLSSTFLQQNRLVTTTPPLHLLQSHVDHSNNDNNDNDDDDTIYALSTGSSLPTAVAVIRISGPRSHAILQQLTPNQKSVPLRKAVVRTLIHPSDHTNVLDQALVLTFKAPQSFTGEDVVELHTHGSRAVVQGILQALSECNTTRLAERGEFTQRAFGKGKLDLLEVEALADLLISDTAAQRRQALSQLEGNLSQLYTQWRIMLTKGLAHAEAVIDFGDDLDDDDTHSNVWGTVEDRMNTLRLLMQHHLADGKRGELVRDGLQICIVGPPNAGKSSLFNLLAKRDAAIVSSIAGTTRDVLELTLDLGGVRCTLSDTAGVRESTMDIIEQEGIKRAKIAAEKADIVVAMIDGTNSTQGWEALQGILLDGSLMNRTMVVMNKLDLVMNPTSIEWTCQIPTFGVSCDTNQGVDAFLDSLTERVVSRVSQPTSSNSGESALITRARHRQHVEAAVEALNRFSTLAQQGPMAVDMAAEELRLATSELGRITGAVDVEDVLDVLFADFCIGK